MLDLITNAETQIELSLMAFRQEVEKARQQDVVRARKYYDGDHPVHLTERMQEFLGLENLKVNDVFRLNVSKTVITAVLERLLVTGFDTNEQPAIVQTEEGAPVKHKPIAEWALDMWDANRMDAKQTDIHRAALRDGETFVIVDYDEVSGRPYMVHHPRFTDTQVGGDGYGVFMVYPNNNPDNPPAYAVKQWTETVLKNGKLHTRQRQTRYYPERVERYAYEKDGWAPIVEENGKSVEFPVPWVDKQGNPLGIAAVHFRNEDLGCEAWEAFGPQDAINKTLIDLMAAADMSAFRILVAFGWLPTTDGTPPKADGSNALKIAPGELVGSTKSKTEASLEAIDPADLTSLTALLQDLVMWTAVVTDTPLSRFRITKQLAAEGTQQEEKEPLFARIRQRQYLFGNAWEDAMLLAAKLEQVHGDDERLADIPENLSFSTQWDEVQARNAKEQFEEWAAWKQQHVPQTMIWRRMGLSEAEIAEALQSPEYQSYLSMLTLNGDDGLGG